jgi:hypothetical protein
MNSRKIIGTERDTKDRIIAYIIEDGSYVRLLDLCSIIKQNPDSFYTIDQDGKKARVICYNNYSIKTSSDGLWGNNIGNLPKKKNIKP